MAAMRSVGGEAQGRLGHAPVPEGEAGVTPRCATLGEEQASGAFLAWATFLTLGPNSAGGYRKGRSKPAMAPSERNGRVAFGKPASEARVFPRNSPSNRQKDPRRACSEHP